MDCNNDCFPRGYFFSFIDEMFPSSTKLDVWGKYPPTSPAQGPKQSLPNPGDRAQGGGSWRVGEDLAGASVRVSPLPFKHISIPHGKQTLL